MLRKTPEVVSVERWIGGSGELIRLGASSIDRVVKVLTQAFADYPMMTFYLPDAVKRRCVLPWYMRTVVRYVLLYGEVYTTATFDGVVCWLPPNNQDPTIKGLIRSGFWALPLWFGRDAFQRFKVNGCYMRDIRKAVANEPHWYLLFLGVEPSRQGGGIGAKLIQPKLLQADSERVPCYLETYDDKNLSFYEKHGFEVVSDSQVPGYGLRVWAMLRRPRSRIAMFSTSQSSNQNVASD